MEKIDLQIIMYKYKVGLDVLPCTFSATLDPFGYYLPPDSDSKNSKTTLSENGDYSKH